MTKLSTNFLFLAAAGLLAVSCSSNDVTGNDPNTSGNGSSSAAKRIITVSASAAGDDSSTRVGYTQNTTNTSKADMFWQSGDQLGLFYAETSGSDLKQASMNLNSESVGKSVGSFTSTESISGTPSCVVCPYSASTSLSGTTLSYTFPSKYTYTSVAKGANSVNIPYYGSLKSGATVDNFSTTLTALSGVLAVKIPYLPKSSGYVILTSDQKISGTFSTTVSSDATTDGFQTSTTNTPTEKSVTINFSGATEGENTDGNWFYFPLPVGTHNLSLQIVCISTSGSEKSYLYSTPQDISKKVITKGKIVQGNLSKVTNNDSYTEVKPVTGKDNVYQSATNDNIYYIKGDKDNIWHEMVDLGLTTTNNKKLLFATMNVSATSVYSIGSYFAWGETATKSNYSKDTYKYYDASTSSTTKYDYSKKNEKILEKDDDAAYVNWGTAFRMPTNGEFQKLSDTKTFTNSWATENKTNGWKFTKTGSTLSIFFPCTGICEETYIGKNNTSNGYYWSSTACPDHNTCACDLFFANTGMSFRTGGQAGRYSGECVRPVAEL